MASSETTDILPVTLLREKMQEREVDAFLVPMSDAFQSEFVVGHNRRIEWLSGFTGSYGVVVVTANNAALFTDGRYTLQASQEVDTKFFTIHNIQDIQPWEWLAEHLETSAIVGFDPWLHTIQNIKHYATAGIKLRAGANLIDLAWHDQPTMYFTPIQEHPIEFSGEPSEVKRELISLEMVRKQIDITVLTNPASICWLLNIRANDLPHTPVALCYALLNRDGTLMLFVDKERVSAELREILGEDISIITPSSLADTLNFYIHKSYRFQLDSASCPYWFDQYLKEHGVTPSYAADPCQLPKACKNPIELTGIREAHRMDGVAVTKFLFWLELQYKKHTITELDAVQQLLEFRKANDAFLGNSFDTIAGYGEHGAIVHYHATSSSSIGLTGGSLFLVDSGGQYMGGTTDITRTIAIGSPLEEHIEHFTYVLKGHIALAFAVFPYGTTGTQLDVLARQFLWRKGLDYDHGTGHGVGCYLNVHEGPQRISKASNTTTLEAGMIVSIEPGYYKTGEYGIRIENLAEIVEVPKLSKDGRRFLGFKILSLAPIDLRLVDKEMLTDEEINWLNGYHAKIYDGLVPHLEHAEQHWLRGNTWPI